MTDPHTEAKLKDEHWTIILGAWALLTVAGSFVFNLAVAFIYWDIQVFTWTGFRIGIVAFGIIFGVFFAPSEGCATEKPGK